MNCSICHIEFEDGNNTMFNKSETFTFKPADVLDTVNAAKVTPAELAESRKAYQKTVVATVFHLWGKADIPAGAYNFRHTHCGVVQTGVLASTTGSYPTNWRAPSPMMKHQIRYSRQAGKVCGGQY
jgi:hypothetical protein